MDAYVYQAALLCETCAGKVKARLDPVALASEDSGDCPQGPYGDGGGEADVPQHCDHCGVFLENPLTSEGYQYVREATADETSHNSVLAEWISFYELDDE